jgi:hypothetical protein
MSAEAIVWGALCGLSIALWTLVYYLENRP